MNGQPCDSDHDQAEQITREIAQTFEFLSDVIDNPQILDVIPDGAALSFRDIVIEGQPFRLTAYRTSRMRQWAARVTGAPDAAKPDELIPTNHRRPVRGATDAAALDALETRLRTTAARTALAS